MWQIEQNVQTHPAGGVAPSRHDLARRAYIETKKSRRRSAPRATIASRAATALGWAVAVAVAAVFPFA